MSRTLTACLVAGGLALLGSAPATLANGNYSHVWVARDAIGHLPAGDLRDVLQDPHLANIVSNGAMYPDGGYAVGDGYGEISHWEPFHLAYLGWIRDTYDPPWSPEALEHIAFLLGMAAHGLTDQMYDGMYLERYYVFDQDGCADTSFGTDGSTDSCFAAKMGPIAKPVPWVPAEVLAPLYEQTDGHLVEVAKIKQGHNLVPFAIVHANVEGGDPEIIAEYMARCPWACGHQDDPTVPGSPVSCGPAVAAYWQVLWARLAGDEGFGQPLLDVWFTGGQPWEIPTDAGNPDAWVSFMLPRGLEPSTVTADTVRVTRDDDGSVHPTRAKVYYGRSSHLVNVMPEVDWSADAAYTITVAPPIASWDGVTLETAHVVAFATYPNPDPPEPEVIEVPPEAIEPAPEVVEPAPDVVEPAPDVVEPAPEVVEPAPEVVELAPEVVEPAPDAVEPAPDAGVEPDAAAADESSGGGGGCTLAGSGPSRSGSLSLVLPVLLGLALARARRRA